MCFYFPSKQMKNKSTVLGWNKQRAAHVSFFFLSLSHPIIIPRKKVDSYHHHWWSQAIIWPTQIAKNNLKIATHTLTWVASLSPSQFAACRIRALDHEKIKLNLKTDRYFQSDSAGQIWTSSNKCLNFSFPFGQAGNQLSRGQLHTAAARWQFKLDVFL